MVTFAIIILILLVCAVLLFTGKGGFLIAGYNTMSKAEKQAYDEKKLSRAVGAFLLFTALAMVPFLFMQSGYLLPFVLVLVPAMIVLIYYANKKCFK